MNQSGNQPVVGNGAGNSAAHGYLKRLVDYAVDSPAKTLSLTVLTYGGVLLLVYFARISFLPDVNLEAVTSVLYAVALVGLLLAGYTATTLVMPGLLLGSNLDDGSLTKVQVGLVASVVAVVWIGLVLGLFSDLGEWFWIGCAVMALLALLAAAWRYRHGWSVDKGSAKQWSWAAAMAVVCSALMALPIVLVSVLGMHGDLAHSDDWKAAVILIFAAIVIAMTAWLVGTMESSKRWKFAMLLAPLMLFVVSMITGSFSAISVIAVNKLGLGEQHFVRAVVSGKTCKVVNQALGQNVCDPQAEDDAPTAICPAVLRSRIGSQVLLEFSGIKLEGTPTKLTWATPAGIKVDSKQEPFFRRVVLPKEQLLTWSSLSQQVEQAASAPVSNGLASWLPKDSGGEAQPEALAKALAVVCQATKPPKAPNTGTSAAGPATAASAPTLIKIDAKGSASHQTVVNVQLQNALSQNASALSAAGARSGADAKVLIKRTPPQVPKCPAASASVDCCQPRCCAAPARDTGPVPTACVASAPG
jgi:hypothetical protein